MKLGMSRLNKSHMKIDERCELRILKRSSSCKSVKRITFVKCGNHLRDIGHLALLQTSKDAALN